MPGDDFMREVFRLKKDGVGVAFNQPKTIVYVVRVIDVNPLPEVLWKGFLAEDYSTYELVGYGEQYDTIRAWREQIKSAAGFEWNREVYRPTRR